MHKLSTHVGPLGMLRPERLGLFFRSYKTRIAAYLDLLFTLNPTAQQLLHVCALPAVSCLVRCSPGGGYTTCIPSYQASNGGAAFFAGKSINNKEPKEQASIAGAVAMALHVRQMAKFYGIPVVLHSDHCAKKLLPWFDGMLQADEASCFSF